MTHSNSTIKPTTPEQLPGRSCPLHYRYSPSVFNQSASAPTDALDVLYVVGGLYGNVLALQAIESMFATETGRRAMVFNGDFHWFDASRDWFEQIEAGVSRYGALRGNVETELAGEDDSAGCGCAYPEWVQDGVVEHSNSILQILRGCASTEAKARLARLPMWQRASVAGRQIAIVHGDAESLAGWGFAQEHLSHETHQQTVASWFEAANVDVFASTHTCLPVMQEIVTAGKHHWVINNGAAGMPNFEHDTAGLITRIATTPPKDRPSRAGVNVNGLYIDLLAVQFDQARWQAMFMDLWPPGSHAHASYWQRIVHGPQYQSTEVIRPQSLESKC
jgi:hypothetical protein